MGITFHCEYCGKKIEAPETAGGKWGKCPGCKNRVYVPGEQADEELRLAPLDKEEERKQQELLAETVRLKEDILSETGLPPDEVASAKGQASAGSAGALSDAELMTSIIAYLRQMADGELEEAERTAKAIIPNGAKVARILERMALSKIPEPEIADIPHNVLSGLIKDLCSRLR
jgi:phage FluMu protein Com